MNYFRMNTYAYVEKRQSLLPTSLSDNIKCLDFDVDKVSFLSVNHIKERIISSVKPCNKPVVDVMEMV